MIALLDSAGPELRAPVEEALLCLDADKEKSTFEAFSRLPLRSWYTPKPSLNESVLLHGDSWCNNFMFLFDNPEDPTVPSKVKFLDWQLSRMTSPAVELAYFFYSNASKEILDRFEDYLQMYYETLSFAVKELGSDIEKSFPFLKLKEHWKVYSRFGFIMTIILFQGFYNKNGAIPDIGELLENEEEAKNFNEGGQHNNPLYRERIRNLVFHYADNGFL